MSAGAPYGAAYGMATAFSGVPDAMIQGEEIRRRREFEDMQRAQWKTEMDRLRTQREIEGHTGKVPNEADQTVYGQRNMDQEQFTGETPGAMVRTKRGAIPYDQFSQMEGAGSGDLTPDELYTPDKTVKRPLDEAEKRQRIFENKADFAMQKGRGDLATGYLDESHKASIDNQLVIARKAHGQLMGSDPSSAVGSINQLGAFGQVAAIKRQPDTGDLIFTMADGTNHPMSTRQVDDVMRRLETDPTFFSRYIAPQEVRGQFGNDRAGIRSTSQEKINQAKLDFQEKRGKDLDQLKREGYVNAYEIAKLRVAAMNLRTSMISSKQSDYQFAYQQAKQMLLSENPELADDPSLHTKITAVVNTAMGGLAEAKGEGSTRGSLKGLGGNGGSGLPKELEGAPQHIIDAYNRGETVSKGGKDYKK